MNTTPPPGWFPDPANAAFVRYWDGSAWTAHTQPMAPTTNPAPQSAAFGAHTATTQPTQPTQPAAAVDEHGDLILFQERTLGAAKSNVTVTANRLTVAKRSIAFADVTGLSYDVTQILSFGIKSGVSYTIGLNGDSVKSVGIITQNLPMRSGREQADRQFTELINLLERHLVPQLLRRLHNRVMSGLPIEVVGANLTREGIQMKKSFIRWDQYCGTVEEGRSVSILGPTPDIVVGTTYVRFVNARLLARLCDLCAKGNS